ncbi:terpenoid synthase [Physcia stellaris]|nr:terpenoid synthase [Physcia stellaris]
MDQISPQTLASFLVEYLHKSSYRDEDPLPRNELEDLYSYTISFLPGNTKIAQAMSEYVHATYFFLPLNIRKAVAVYNGFQMIMDDVPQETNDSLDLLCSQLAASEGVSHPAWQQFFKFLPQLFEHYGPYAQTTMFRGALEFMQATCLERTLFKGYPGSKYPHYLRRMGSQGPVQAAVCFPKSEFPQEEYLPIIATIESELEYFVGIVNDLFSFYKESSSSYEKTNYPLNQAACTQQDVSIVLQEGLETAIACQKRTLDIVEGIGNKAVSQRVQQFFVGYTRYHLACSRYKIAELCLESGNQDLAYFYSMSCKAMGVPIHSGLVDMKALRSSEMELSMESLRQDAAMKTMVASNGIASRA